VSSQPDAVEAGGVGVGVEVGVGSVPAHPTMSDSAPPANGDVGAPVT
jgi:hypothetical protein